MNFDEIRRRVEQQQSIPRHEIARDQYEKGFRDGMARAAHVISAYLSDYSVAPAYAPKPTSACEASERMQAWVNFFEKLLREKA